MYLLSRPSLYRFCLAGGVFILATLLGFASHRPQSRRVRRGDAGGVAAVQQNNWWHAGVFRILYFWIPFGISISIMGARELLAQRGAALAGTPRLSEACTAEARVRQPPTAASPEPVTQPCAGNSVVIPAIGLSG